VLLSGTNVDHMSRSKIAKQLSFVPQSGGVQFNYTGLDMVIMGKAPHLGLLSSPGRKERDEAASIMESLGISHLKNSHYAEMSSGEKQMTLLGRAVMQNTPLLLLDEPTSHLDIKNQHIVMEMVKEIARNGDRTLFITIHDPNLALKYCDYVIMVGDGKLHAEGPTSSVMTDDNLSTIYGMKIRNEVTSSGQRVIVQHGSENGRAD
ncbi:MAG: ABC transporter ATP-binding protein, partial [Actinobacteria bacterium]|nr:ABC transporter ATP-binding protein [Actinomycetota bacterium]